MKNYLPNFDYEAHDIVRFAQSDNLFTLLLKDKGTIIHYNVEQKDKEILKDWLTRNKIPDAKSHNLDF